MYYWYVINTSEVFSLHIYTMIMCKVLIYSHPIRKKHSYFNLWLESSQLWLSTLTKRAYTIKNIFNSRFFFSKIILSHIIIFSDDSQIHICIQIPQVVYKSHVCRILQNDYLGKKKKMFSLLVLLSNLQRVENKLI